MFKRALLHACNIFQGTVENTPAFGWHEKSLGHPFITHQNAQKWLSISHFNSYELADSYINRIQSANTLKEIKKPQFLDSIIWEEDKKFYTASLMSYVKEAVCAKTSYLEKEINISETWLSHLKIQLDSLSTKPCDYVSCRQDLINRRVKERYGDVECEIENWATIHGDLNWSNLTTKTPYLLDWEGWGKGPYGLDIAFLYCFSLTVQPVAHKIRKYFHEWFTTLDAPKCLLFVCSELTRMIELYNDHPALRLPLFNLAQEILKNPKSKL